MSHNKGSPLLKSFSAVVHLSCYLPAPNGNDATAYSLGDMKDDGLFESYDYFDGTSSNSTTHLRSVPLPNALLTKVRSTAKLRHAQSVAQPGVARYLTANHEGMSMQIQKTACFDLHSVKLIRVL